ncbi:MAG: ferritin family protein [Chromatiales bacterium]|nr:ferritin family protein [Chromatiales bacterium]
MTEGHQSGRARLEATTTLREALTVATEFERTARDFYRDLAPRVSKRIRWLVDELAAEEQTHFELFSELAGRVDAMAHMDEALARPASDARFSDCIQLPDLGDAPDDQAVLQYALGREHAAMEQYRALAEVSPSDELRRVFEFLANEETQHKAELEKLYYELIHAGGV